MNNMLNYVITSLIMNNRVVMKDTSFTLIRLWFMLHDLINVFRFIHVLYDWVVLIRTELMN